MEQNVSHALSIQIKLMHLLLHLPKIPSELTEGWGCVYEAFKHIIRRVDLNHSEVYGNRRTNVA